MLALTGCPKKTGDAGDAAAEAGATADAGPEAANEADVTRYLDEVAVDHQAATIKAPKANALKATPKGDIVAALKKGDSVTELGEHNGYYRVVFADPKDASRKLEGWVVKFAFDDPPVAKKRPVRSAPAPTRSWSVTRQTRSWRDARSSAPTTRIARAANASPRSS